MFKVRRAFYIQLCAIVLVIGAVVLLSRTYAIVDLIAGLQQRIATLGMWSAIWYPLLFALCNVLLLPGGILTVGAGFFFGLWWGFAIVFIGNAISVAISFAISRWLGSRWLSRRLEHNRTLEALRPAIEQEGWKIILLSQLHPLFPTSLVNYLFGLTRIQFRTYMFWSSVGRIPGLFLYTYMGTLGQFGLNIAQGKAHPMMVEYWMWGGAFAITALIVIVSSRIALRGVTRVGRKNNSGAEATPSDSLQSLI